jgi:hypothetical protein
MRCRSQALGQNVNDRCLIVVPSEFTTVTSRNDASPLHPSRISSGRSRTTSPVVASVWTIPGAVS